MTDLRIGVVSAADPADRNATSGTLFSMVRAIEQHVGSVVHLGPAVPFSAAWRRARNVASRAVLGRRWPYEHAPALARAYSRTFQRRIRTAGALDAVFAPFASCEIADLDTPLPIIYAADATLALLRGYHAGFTGLTERYAVDAAAIERRALERAAAISYPSEWAKRSAEDAYGIEPSRISVLPFGPNLLQIPNRDEVRDVKRLPNFALLFLATSWEAKGGPIALQTVELLRARGLPAELTICGCTPPSASRRAWMRVIPRLDKSDPAQEAILVRTLLEARILLLPTRNDCFGIVFAEASACGTPSISTDTGGVSAAVRNGINGYTLPLDATATSYADLIAPLLEDRDKYANLSTSSRTVFERVLNWDSWGRGMATIFRAQTGA